MSGTFACPHCGASYPIKPVLVGRAVRCTTCKNAFSLRPDGIADKVDTSGPHTVVPQTAPPAPAPAATEPPPPRPAVAPAPRVRAEVPTPEPSAAISGGHALTSDDQPATDKPPSQRLPKAGTQRLGKPGTTRLTKQQEDDRRTMAASLASAANVALKTETGRQEAPEAPKRGTSAVHRPETKREGRIGSIGPAVTTGEGLRNHRNNVIWAAGGLGAIGVLVVFSLLLTMRSPQRASLEAYAAVVEGPRSQHPTRMPAIQERAWITGVPALTDLGRVRLGGPQVIALAGARPAIATIAGMTYQRNRDLWTPTGADVGRLWQDKRDRPWNLKHLQDAKIAVVDHADLRAQVKAAGVSDDGFDLLVLLLTSQPTPNGAEVSKRLRAGDLPDTVEVCAFTGRAGSLLQDLGRAFTNRTVDYQGRLLRFVGDGWPKTWRVVEVRTTTRP